MARNRVDKDTIRHDAVLPNYEVGIRGLKQQWLNTEENAL